MLRRGTDPFLECSSRGVRQLSAFYARPACLQGRSIEEAYQAMKVFEDGTTGLDWRRAKGKKAVNVNECAVAYKEWWREYLLENPILLARIKAAAGLSDMFGQEGHVCQATVLWDLRGEL